MGLIGRVSFRQLSQLNIILSHGCASLSRPHLCKELGCFRMLMTTSLRVPSRHSSSTGEPQHTENKFVPQTMENQLKRVPLGVRNDDHQVEGKEYLKYKRQTRTEYEDLMMEFEFRCRRAAMMNYYEASGYDSSIYRMEVVAAFLGTVSISAVAAWFLPNNSWSFDSVTQLGTLGLLGLGGACLVHFFSKGSSRWIPSLSRRAEVNIDAGAAWQRLAQTTRSFRIRLDNPRLDVADYATWYEQLIEEREKLSKMASIPQSTYERFSDPKLVYSIMSERRKMFLQYMDLENSELEDLRKTANGEPALIG